MSRLRSPFWRMLSLLALAPLLLAVAFAQPPDKKTSDEEEDPKSKPMTGKKPAKGDEEVDDKPPDKPIRIEDPKTDPTKGPVGGIVDLAAHAKFAKEPAIQKLFGDLAIAHDVFQTGGDPFEARPIKKHLNGLAPSAKVKLEPIDKNTGKPPLDKKSGKPFTEYSPSVGAIRSKTYYEELAMKAVDSFLQKYPDKVDAAELVLAAAAQVHESARDKDDAGWHPLRDALRKRRASLSLQRLQSLAEKGNWPAAVSLAGFVVKNFSAGEQAAIAEAMKKLAALTDSAEADERKKVIAGLRQLEELLPKNETTKPLRDKLEKLAQPLVDAIQSLQKQLQTLEAAEPKDLKRIENLRADIKRKLTEAAEILPNHPSLRGVRNELDNQYPKLRVGVRELPLDMSPALAFTDEERQVVEMLFEGLYESAPEPDGGRFRPGLALGRPRLTSKGREIVLPSDARWSTGDPITSDDVSHTIQLLRDPKFPGRNAPWADDFTDDNSFAKSDAHRFSVNFKKGYLDPTTLLTFKILPAKAQSAEDPKFARNPVGSGPFQYDSNLDGFEVKDGKEDRLNRKSVSFTPNAFYRNRPGRDRLPHLHEIQLVKEANPVQALRDGKVDMVLDVPAGELKTLRDAPNLKVSAPLSSRRIYLLAVNCQSENLDNAAVRRSIANAIPREALLNAHFRKGVANVHHVLNGPYPTNSWACNPAVKFDASKVKAEARKNFSLKLYFPLGDAAVAAAVEDIKKHVKDETGIELVLIGEAPHQLRDRVEIRRNYDLAYYSYDYPDPTFWLWPLLDARGIGDNKGKNIFNFDSNKEGCEFPGLFRDVLSHRSFDKVRRFTHSIHKVFVENNMPFIPLWQFDRHIACTATVKMFDGSEELRLVGESPTIDPLRIFSTIDSWKVER